MSQILGELKSHSSDWQTLIEQLDTNNDGKIDYSEFITAAVNRAKILSSQNLEIAFKMFDQDGHESLHGAKNGPVNHHRPLRF